MFSFQDVTALNFEELAEPHEAQFVEETAEEDNYEGIACVPEEGGSVIDLDYKTRAVDYWKSGKSKPRTLAGVIQKFKKVKSLRQVRRWEESVNRGGTNTDKLRFIIEYVLTNFENSILDGKIIHDMDLRRWALEGKEEIAHKSFKAGHWWIFHFKKHMVDNGDFCNELIRRKGNEKVEEDQEDIGNMRKSRKECEFSITVNNFSGGSCSKNIWTIFQGQLIMSFQ
ncbi:hypothetical protein Trydic_g4293 [Trypoxylus dichotomus]